MSFNTDERLDTSNFSGFRREVIASMCLDLAFFSLAQTPTVILASERHRLPRHTARWPFQFFPISMVMLLQIIAISLWRHGGDLHLEASHDSNKRACGLQVECVPISLDVRKIERAGVYEE